MKRLLCLQRMKLVCNRCRVGENMERLEFGSLQSMAAE